jgi:hypothetical protein
MTTVTPYLTWTTAPTARVLCCVPDATGPRLASEAAGIAVLTAVVLVTVLVVAMVLALRFAMRTLALFAPAAHAAVAFLLAAFVAGLAVAVLARG